MPIAEGREFLALGKWHPIAHALRGWHPEREWHPETTFGTCFVQEGEEFKPPESGSGRGAMPHSRNFLDVKSEASDFQANLASDDENNSPRTGQGARGVPSASARSTDALDPQVGAVRV